MFTLLVNFEFDKRFKKCFIVPVNHQCHVQFLPALSLALVLKIRFRLAQVGIFTLA